MKAIDAFNEFRARLERGDINPDEPVYLVAAGDFLSGDMLSTRADLLDRVYGPANLHSTECRRLATQMYRWPYKRWEC